MPLFHPDREMRLLRRRRFARQFRRQTERHYLAGDLGVSERDELMDASRDPVVMQKVLDRIANPEVDDEMVGAFTWANLWAFLVENWLTIAKLVFTFAVMVLDEEETE